MITSIRSLLSITVSSIASPAATEEELEGVAEPRMRREATAIYHARAEARARIAKDSPTLQHTESWFETLISVREFIPPGIWVPVNIVTLALTVLDMWMQGELSGARDAPSPPQSEEVEALLIPDLPPVEPNAPAWRIPAHAHNILLSLLSLLLAFRTNQAYDRWWEARKLWGQIVNSTRNVASNAAVFMTDLERKRRVIKAAILFAWCTKASLRATRPSADEISGLVTDEMLQAMTSRYTGPLERRPTLHLDQSAFEEEEADDQGYVYEHLPMLMVDEMKAGIRDELDETVGAKGSAAEVHEGWKIVIGNDIKSLVDALGGCERIQKTPMPFGYLAQQRIFMLLWLLSYPLAIAGDYKWWTVVVCAFVSFIMLKVDAISVEIEHPFTTEVHDLPLEAICITIEKNLLEILRRAESRELRPVEPPVYNRRSSQTARQHWDATRPRNRSGVAFLGGGDANGAAAVRG
mmetsp:Transcript_35394/g.111100  ORF Transcript_35394/g.111100 Transcript_35394/m.111100 type:complete len:466 (-) Transcript_35394:41-1438(-)